MEKYIYNEQNGLWYELQGDYYLPCLKLPEEGEVHIGIWGQRHLRYLKQYHRVRYYNLLTSGKLNDYLVDVETWAQQMFDELVNALSRNENLTEDFKATNPVEWVRKSNNIRNRVAEIVNQELLCRGWFLPPNTYDCGSFVVNGTAVVGKEQNSPYNC